jgi:hypothetical protein
VRALKRKRGNDHQFTGDELLLVSLEMGLWYFQDFFRMPAISIKVSAPRKLLPAGGRE